MNMHIFMNIFGNRSIKCILRSFGTLARGITAYGRIEENFSGIQD